jgi:HEAT repeats
MNCPSIAPRFPRIALLGCALAGAMATAGSLASACAQSTDAPHIANAQMQTRPVGGTLATELKTWSANTAQPQWIGYSVAQVAGHRDLCCSDGGSWNQNCGTCRLESGDHGLDMSSRDASVKLEGPREIAILYRAENRKIMKIRVVSADCAVDAGGLPLIWLTGVKPADSVATLAGYVRVESFDDRDERNVGHAALTAIAMHADDSADRALESFVRPDQPENLSRQSAFWLGEARAKAGLTALQKMAKSDSSAEVRAQVAFALSVSREPGAVEEMIRMAHDDESSRVRGQALFWLAQKAGKKAVGAITGAIENDPDTEVKKKAVFALSQLPKEEGVPKLIEVAQTNRNPAVRKQAMFWLGQSNDPRALAFFERVLTQ